MTTTDSTRNPLDLFRRNAGDGGARRRILTRIGAALLAVAIVLSLLPTVSEALTGKASLKVGSTGTAVKTLQANLIKRGYLKSADGKYGPLTKGAVKLFQQQAGLPATGTADQATQDKLSSLKGNGKTNVTLRSGSGTEVTNLQARLKYLGYLSGSPSSYDAVTKKAVIDFQKARGLTADGVAGPKTLVALYSPNKGEQVAAATAKYLGCKYVYGGTGPDVFDCSGLVYYVYKTHFKTTLNRTAPGLGLNGTEVSLADAKPGDILCFYQNGKTMPIGHAAMYIGNGQFIHAPQTGDVVRVQDLNDKWKSGLGTIRRIFPWN